MKKKKIWLGALAVLLAAALAGGACFIAVKKAYSLYAGLCSRIDYTNDTLYTLNDDISNLRHMLYFKLSNYEFDYSWSDHTPPLIAHAFGGINGNTYTNSLEAFHHNYALGHRVFEVDMDIADNTYQLIAAHDDELWREQAGLSNDTPYTYDNFMASKAYGLYTALDYRNIIDLLISYPDIYIVTDTKHMDMPTVLVQFSQLVKYAASTDITVLDRLIPQIYHENMLTWVMNVHPFKSIIYTLYASGSTPQEAYDFCKRTGIRFITTPAGHVTEEAVALWDSLGITVAAHTVNTPDYAQHLRNLGVDILYTDFLSPQE